MTYNKFAPRKLQSGMLLIEAMVAILIFSIGVIALMGVQAAAIRSTSDAKVRMDAEFFADQLISEMTVDGRDATNNINPAALQSKYSSANAGGGFVRWRNRVFDTTNGGLPGVSITLNPPVVTVTAVMIGGVPSAQVNISLFWRAPSDPPLPAPPRQLVTTTIIRG